MIELEKKFIIDKNTAFDIIKEAKVSKTLDDVQVISQSYLFKKNASVFLNLENSGFDVTLKMPSEDVSFFIPVSNFEFNQITELFKDNLNDDLLDVKSTIRIRFLDNEPIFTLKKKSDGIKGTNEFEFHISKQVATNPKIAEFPNIDLGCVHKTRWVVKKGELKYEIDFFKDFDFIFLEIEFDSEESFDNFNPDFDFIKDATDKSKYKNKNLALKLAELKSSI